MTQQTLDSSGSEPPAFREDLRSALQSFRSAMIELLAAVGADPGKPQEVARRFKLNKNLTWKISKIAGGSDLYAAVPHIPGVAGLRIFLQAMKRAGAPEPLMRAAREAAGEFERVVTVHTGDRHTLEVMVNGLMPASMKSERDEQNRRLAYQGNSATWGVRAKLQLSSVALAPNADRAEMADLLQIGGLAGFHRLRRDARWLLFRRERWDDRDPCPEGDDAESLDPRFPVDRGVPLLGDFCSDPVPAIDVVRGPGEDQYELPPGPVGHTAAFTCIWGQIARRVGPTVADGEGEFAETGCNLITPVEHVLMDLLVHRDLPWAMSPSLAMYGRMDGGAMHREARRGRNLLPVTEPVHDLGWGDAGLATPLLPEYSRMVRTALDRVGWRPDDFRVFRFTMSYPPIPTVVLLRSELPVRAG